MMVLIGASWLLYWLLVAGLGLTHLRAVLITALVFIMAGLLLGERPFARS